MKNILTVEIQNIRGIGHLKINMPLTPDVYAITGINGIGNLYSLLTLWHYTNCAQFSLQFPQKQGYTLQ